MDVLCDRRVAPDNCSFYAAAVAGQSCLHLSGAHAVAADVDDVIHAARDGVVTQVVTPAPIPRHVISLRAMTTCIQSVRVHAYTHACAFLSARDAHTEYKNTSAQMRRHVCTHRETETDRPTERERERGWGG
jgi:hypothetical protein